MLTWKRGKECKKEISFTAVLVNYTIIWNLYIWSWHKYFLKTHSTSVTCNGVLKNRVKDGPSLFPCLDMWELSHLKMFNLWNKQKEEHSYKYVSAALIGKYRNLDAKEIICLELVYFWTENYRIKLRTY